MICLREKQFKNEKIRAVVSELSSSIDNPMYNSIFVTHSLNEVVYILFLKGTVRVNSK